jgi:glycosyltransferase involved in cell wall biosynthesis
VSTTLVTTGLRKSVIAAVYPLASGVAQFNGGMVRGMIETSAVDVISWRRMYPPLLHRGQGLDTSTTGAELPAASFMLDWHDPRSWRRAVRRVRAFQADAMILPWLHPVMVPPYRYFLRHVPKTTARVVICHNVVSHEPLPGLRVLSRATLRRADLFVTHAPHQRAELDAMGLGATPVLEAFHPLWDPLELGPLPTDAERAAERARQGNPDLLLLTFGAIRPYKGVDIALDALALVDRDLHVRLVIAGKAWDSADGLRAQVRDRGLADRVEIRDRFIPNDEAALLFSAADASLLPYRSATQSGVVSLSFTYGCPVIATRVGGLPAAVADGVDGILCEPDAADVARAIECMAAERSTLAAGVLAGDGSKSFRRYGELIDEALLALA